MLANIYKNLFNDIYVFNVVNTDIQGKKYNIFLFPLKEKGLTLKTNFMKRIFFFIKIYTQRIFLNYFVIFQYNSIVKF